MYTINITQQSGQKCQKCQNSLIEYIGTQAWCTGCNRVIRTIEQETKVVPKMYQSNCKDKIPSTEIKIKNYLNEFCNKYGGINDIEEINFLYKQVVELRDKKGIMSKNYRENSAVIVYVHFMDCHRLSIKEFCKKNQVEQKSFNKCYLMYQKVMKEKKLLRNQRKIQEEDDDLIKEEDLKIESTEEEFGERYQSEDDGLIGRGDMRQENGKVCARELNRSQESSAKRQSKAKNQHFDRPHQQNTIQNLLINHLALTRQIRSFLQPIFYSFFKSPLYTEKKILLIEELTQQILEVYQTLKILFQSTNSSFYLGLEGSINDENFYKYLFYIVLRRISHGISQMKYRKVINEATGESIKPTLLKSVIKALDVREETASSVSGDSFLFVQNSGTTGSEFVKIEEKE